MIKDADVLSFLLKIQDQGQLHVEESQQNLSLILSQSNFLREESILAIPFSFLDLFPALCIMSFSPWLLIACLHPLSFFCLSPIGQEIVLWPSSAQSLTWNSPACTACPGAPHSQTLSTFALAISSAWHAFLSFSFPTHLPFMTNSTVPSLENLHWQLPPSPKKNWVFPSLGSRAGSGQLQAQSLPEVTVALSLDHALLHS